MSSDVTIDPNDNLRDVLTRLPSGAVVTLKPGVYQGGLELRRSVTLRGLGGPEGVRLDADDRGSCLSIPVDDIDVVVEGVTLTGGNGEAGGAVAVHAMARATLVNCVLSGNRSRQTPGGAVYLAEGELTLRRCLLVDNVADNAPAVFADEIATLRLEDCFATDEVGPTEAVIRIRDGAEVTIVRSTVMARGSGSAIHVSGTTTRKPEVIISDSVLCGANAIDSPSPFGAVVQTARSVLSSTQTTDFLDLGGTIVAPPKLSHKGVPAADSPAIGLARGGGTVDLRGRPRPDQSAAGAIEPE